MCFAGTGRTVDVEEVFRPPWVSQHQGETVGGFVAATDHEIVETVPGGDGEVEYLLHGQKSFPWGDSGAMRPKCSYAALVATRPRGVRFKKPFWIRNGS